MISISRTCNKIESGKFGINEYFDFASDSYIEAKDMICFMLREPNKVVRLKERLKKQLIRNYPDIKDNDNLNIIFVQAIVEAMKRIYIYLHAVQVRLRYSDMALMLQIHD